ncbi:MAG TPA: hypothetical protein VGL66_10270 [Caulobacteraceae bacterium]|jgi:hypothetical protein
MRFALMFAVLGAVSAAVAASAADERPAQVSPVLFAPEATWPAGADVAPAFTPDGRTVFFTHSEGEKRTIMLSHRGAHGWSAPSVAPFSGTWRDIEPYMAPDGSYLVFVSNRPATPGGKPLDGYFGGQARPGKGGNLWRVDRKGVGWGEPHRLPDVINAGGAIYSPAVARDGSIYFNQPDPVTHKSHIYRAQATSGGFRTPVSQAFSDGDHPAFDAAVAPDESFIVFGAPRPPAQPNSSALFVAYRQGDGWSAPQALTPLIGGIEARLSPDLKTLYFSDAPAGASESNAPIRIFATPFDAHAAVAPLATTPKIFAPGIVSTPVGEDSATFAPDGRTVWFDRGVGRDSMILMSHRTASGWSEPQIAPFSGQWSDRDPVMAPDGSFLVFCSNRPDQPGGKPLDMVAGDGSVRPGQGSHLWRVERRGAGWSAPEPLPGAINDSTRLFSPSIAGDGSLWYQRPDDRLHVYHLMRAQRRDGVYDKPVEVMIGPETADERDPAVAPDESFIVFGANYAAKGQRDRLHIAFREGDHWSAPVDLGDTVNADGAEGPHLGPGGRTLYYDSTASAPVAYPRTRAQAKRTLARVMLWDDGNSHVWSVPLDPWLRAHAAGAGRP